MQAKPTRCFIPQKTIITLLIPEINPTVFCSSSLIQALLLQRFLHCSACSSVHGVLGRHLPASSSSSLLLYLITLPPLALLPSMMCLPSLLFSTLSPLLVCYQLGNLQPQLAQAFHIRSERRRQILSTPVALPPPPRRKGTSYGFIFQSSFVLINNYAIFSGYLLTAKESKPEMVCRKTRQGSFFQALTKEFCWMISSQQRVQWKVNSCS